MQRRTFMKGTLADHTLTLLLQFILKQRPIGHLIITQLMMAF